jgi:hypothetical protein
VGRGSVKRKEEQGGVVGLKIVGSDAQIGLSWLKYSFGILHTQSFVKVAGTLNLYPQNHSSDSILLHLLH